nr:hypothetical protein [Tanacetum cinerariifolium]
QNENVFEEDIKLLKLDVMLRDNALVELRKKFKKAKKERDEFKQTLEKFQTSSKNLNDSMPTSHVNDRYKSGEGYHAVPPPYTRTFMSSKSDLVFHDAPTASERVPNGYPQQALKDKGVIDSGCSRYMTRNISYLSDFEEINSGYVAFCGNLKGGKITGKGIQGNFDAGKVVKEVVSTQQYVLLPLWSTGSQDPQNTNVDAAFDVKVNEN